MKNLAGFGFIAIFIFSSVVVKAQQYRTGKIYLFNNFPPVINCTAKQLNNFFLAEEGQDVKVDFEKNLTINGTVKRRFTKFNKVLETIILKLAAFNNISFSISRRIDAQNEIIYSAHLFDSAYADGYQLKKISFNNYQFTKILMDKILPTCSL